ncbi:MAG: hypothetical protein IPM35_10145 [Myxococcales bacterium]|nr:hypothetical protein [Myxococcales bacterium]
MSPSSYVPIAAAIVGWFLGVLSTRWALKLADRLARHRERQRDDREYKRRLQLDRYERQREAVAAYAEARRSIPEGGAGPTRQISEYANLPEVRALVLFAFEDEGFAESSEKALLGLWSCGRTGLFEARHAANAHLGAMRDAAAQTWRLLDAPPAVDMTPLRDRALGKERTSFHAQLDKMAADLRLNAPPDSAEPGADEPPDDDQ